MPILLSHAYDDGDGEMGLSTMEKRRFGLYRFGGPQVMAKTNQFEDVDFGKLTIVDVEKMINYLKDNLDAVTKEECEKCFGVNLFFLIFKNLWIFCVFFSNLSHRPVG